MTAREPNWFYGFRPAGVVVQPVTLKVRWALSTRGLRHRIVAARAAWLNGEVRYAGTWLCGDGGTNITLLHDDSDEGRVCTRCKLREDWPAGPVVYRISDSLGALIYIGSTGNLGSRLYAHSRRSSWWADELRIDVTSYPSLPLALSAEAKAIDGERPPQNYMHNPSRGRRRPRAVVCQ